MTKCAPGHENYKGICVPSYFLTSEREEAYQAAQKAKSKNKTVGVVVGIVAAIAVAAYVVLNFVA